MGGAREPDDDAEARRVARARLALEDAGIRGPGPPVVQFAIRLLEALDLTVGEATDDGLVHRAALDVPGGALGLVMGAPELGDRILGRSSVTVHGAAATAMSELGSAVLRSARGRLPAGALPVRTEEERDLWRSGRAPRTMILCDYRAVRAVVVAHLPHLELDDGDPIDGSDNDVYELLFTACADFDAAVGNADVDRVRRHAVLLHELEYHGDPHVENAVGIEYGEFIDATPRARAALREVGHGHLASAPNAWRRELERMRESEHGSRRGGRRRWWSPRA